MVSTPNPINFLFEGLTAYLDRLQHNFAAMDRDYANATKHYGFQCDGCGDNCCRTRFYHHTYLEYLYIRIGFEKLDPQIQRRMHRRAIEVCRKTAKAQEKGIPVRLWCPLNDAGLCTLYHFRPMICRLHGIPHELQRPGQNVLRGPGCGKFDDLCAHKRYFKFDRTPFYFEMAKLEGEFKKAVGLTGKIKMTVAEMIARKEHDA